MQIHELPSTDINDTDKLAFDTGENTYSGQFVNIANRTLAKLTSYTFSGLTTTVKTVIGAINELASTIENSMPVLIRSSCAGTTHSSMGYLQLTYNGNPISRTEYNVLTAYVYTTNVTGMCIPWVSPANGTWFVTVNNYINGSFITDTAVTIHYVLQKI